MVAHAAVGKQHVADEEMTVVHRATRGRERRRRDRDRGTRTIREVVHQRIDDRPDVAARRAVECRAVLEVALARALRGEPRERRARIRDRRRDRRGA
jgi:hypothetical protein